MKVEIRELTKEYSDGKKVLRVLDSLSYTFPEKGTVAIVGPSGIGKSTLLHLISGIDVATSGEVMVGDCAVTSLTEDQLADFRRDHIGFVFQFHHLLPEFTALENVAMPLFLKEASADAAYDKAIDMLERVMLGERIGHRPGELSGGEQQRVALARALVTEPRVVLADEPTGNLDPASAEEICNLLLSVKSEQDRLLIVVTHSRELAQRMDHVLEMTEDGELIPVVFPE